MAVHPFAKKCEAVIASLLEILANLKKAKKKAKKMGGKGGSGDVRIGTWNDIPVRYRFPDPQMERQGMAFGSERGLNANYDKAQPKPPKRPRPSGDRAEDQLQWNYIMAKYKCKVQLAKANEAYFRCRAQKDSTREGCKHLLVQVPCPAAVAALEALDNYRKSKAGASGGGGGGGF